MGSSHAKGYNHDENMSGNGRLGNRKSSKKKSKKGICRLEDLLSDSSTNLGSRNDDENYQGSLSTSEYTNDQLYKSSASTEDCDGGPVYHYPTDSQTRGHIFIINNFAGVDVFGYRRGSGYDFGKLKTVFEALDFEVHEEKNLTAEKMRRSCEDWAKWDYTDVGCAVVVILTHGFKDGDVKGIDGKYGDLMGTDGNFVKLQELTSLFFADKSSPTLIGKPKIFIIQACRGNEDSEGIREPRESQTTTSSDRGDEDFRKVAGNRSEVVDNDERGYEEDIVSSGFLPRNADVIVAYSCSEGEQAFRNTDGGSWYIGELTKALGRPRKTKMHFADILTEVQGMMSNLTNRRQGVPYLQMPEYRSSLRGPLYL